MFWICPFLPFFDVLVLSVTYVCVPNSFRLYLRVEA